MSLGKEKSGNAPWIAYMGCRKTSVWASEKYIAMDVFNPESETKQLAVTPNVTRSGLWHWGADSPWLRSRNKSKCTRLANVESAYDPRMKKKWRWSNLLILPCISWGQNDEKTKMIKFLSIVMAERSEALSGDTVSLCIHILAVFYFPSHTNNLVQFLIKKKKKKLGEYFKK